MVFMVCQDFLGTNMVIAESRGQGRVAGICDALNDFASRYGGGIMAYSVIRYDLLSWQTFMIVCCVSFTSFFTTNAVTMAHTGKKKRIRELL